MDGAIKLVGPRCVRKDALDPEIQLRCRLLRTDRGGESPDNFVTSLREILGAIVKNLRPIVSSDVCPAFCLACSLDSVANVFAVAQRGFAQQTSVSRTHFHAVTGIRTRLLAANVELH